MKTIRKRALVVASLISLPTLSLGTALAADELETRVAATLFKAPPDHSRAIQAARSKLNAIELSDLRAGRLPASTYLAYAQRAADCVASGVGGTVTQPKLVRGRASWTIRVGGDARTGSPTVSIAPASTVNVVSKRCFALHLSRVEPLFVLQNLPEGESWTAERDEFLKCISAAPSPAAVARVMRTSPQLAAQCVGDHYALFEIP